MRNEKPTLSAEWREKLYALVSKETARRVSNRLKVSESTIARAIAGLEIRRASATQIEVSLKQEATKEKDRK